MITETSRILALYKKIGVNFFLSPNPIGFNTGYNQDICVESSQKYTVNNSIDIQYQEVGATISDAISLPKEKSFTSDIDIIYKELGTITSFQELYSYMLNFDRCSLKDTAMNLVLGDGNLNADIMLLGEAPGADEDEQGKPFVGRSGRLLTKAFESIEVYRTKNLFITNTIFWRPPGNRDPNRQEVDICFPIVNKIIDIISPKILILVGKVAANNILSSGEEYKNISSLMKKWGNFVTKEGTQTLTRVIYHPAYLLRSPTQKKLLWEDLLEIKQKITDLNIKV